MERIFTSIITFLVSAFCLLLILFFFIACSDTTTGHGEFIADGGDETPSYTFKEISEKIKDLPPLANSTTIPNLEFQYMQDCYEEEWYFCPPLDAVWQFKLVTDICKDPPEIIELGPCEEKLECDPSNDTVEIIECLVDDQQGSQQKWCEKGVWKYSDCNPCFDEICDNQDNDCDGEIDEDILIVPCETPCGLGDLLCVDGMEICIGPHPEEEICDYKDNDCDGLIDEDQLNVCGECGPVPDDVCNGFDDDCDGLIDEDLIQPCSTVCGDGLEFCVNGNWIGCSAKQPFEEICNGFDDNCDGLIDEGLDCLCTVDLVGVLFPCFEAPLECGGGYKTCECVDEGCVEIIQTPCYAQCYWEKPPAPNCDPFKGFVENEMCNNHDDNCNQLVDEDLTEACYTGLPETLYVGICKPGYLICHQGEWGNNYTTEAGEELFVPNLCLDEVVPADQDACNGTDDNCDGIVDDGKEMGDTDILFIIDWSGSMNIEIQAVMTALNMFATNYSDEEVIKWGLIVGPVVPPQQDAWSPIEYLQLINPLTEFSQFMAQLSVLDPNSLNGGTEMLYDALYLAIHNLCSSASLPWPLSALTWNSTMQTVDSQPPIDQFIVNWRDDAKRVVIVFTDEEGQSYLYKDLGGANMGYGLTQAEILQTIQGTVDLKIYTFTPETLKNVQKWNGDLTGWEPLTQLGGKWYELTQSAGIMYENLLEILDENACTE